MASKQADIAVVTGAASGIGLATTEILAARGIAVVAVDCDEEKLAHLSGQEGILPLHGDVADVATWDKVVSLARKDLGESPNMFVSNAAIVTVGSTLDLGDEDWRRIFDVNLMGAVRGVRALLPHMIEAGWGSIVIMGSIDSFMVEQGAVAYCATKGALLQFSRSLAIDHARQGIRVNCVCPGVTDTPLFRHHLNNSHDPEAVLALRTGRVPMDRLLTPEEVAKTVAFLLSDEASGITGAMLPVDAGLSTSFEFRSGPEWGEMA